MRKGEFYEVAKQQANGFPVVEGTRCVSVQIPDDDSFLPVLAAMHAYLGNTWSTMGTPDERRAWANMWQRAYAATDWEGCMSCEDVADCIENDGGTQIAITNVINQQVGGQSPLSATNQGANMLTGVPGCALDNLWGAMSGLVDWMNANNEDFLERIATAGTPAERGAVLSENFPGFTGGALGEFLSASITFLSGQLHDGYEASYDQMYADALACELFCIAQETCSLTVRQLYLVLAARVGYTPAGDAFYQGLIFTVTGSWTGTEFADVMMFLQVGAFLFMGGFGGYMGVNPLANALTMGFDDPSNDWMTLCACPDMWTYTLDSATNPVWVEIPDSTVGGTGTIVGTNIPSYVYAPFGSDNTFITVRIVFPTIQTIAGISIHQAVGVNVEASPLNNHFTEYYDAGGVLIGGTGTTLPYSDGEWDFSYSEVIPGVKTIVMQYIVGGNIADMQWNPVMISGFGTNPFI